MGTLYGFNAFLKISEEVTWGIAVTSNQSEIRLNSCSLQTAQERNRKTNLSVPTSGMLASVYDGFRTAGGSLDIPIQYNGSGQLIKMALGAATTTSAGAEYLHEYTPAFDLPSGTIQFQRGTNLTDSMEQFTGAKVSSMSMSCEAGGEMTASFDIIAKDSAARTTNMTSTFPAGDSVLHFESGNLVMGGSLTTASMELRSFELTLDNKLERKNILGSKLTAEPLISDVREVTMSVTADLDDNTVYNDSLSDAAGLVSITFTSTAEPTQFLIIELDNAIIEDYSDSVTSFGRVERTFSIRGLASTATGLKISIRNANAQATYGP